MELVEIKSKMLMLRGQAVLLDRDVASAYGVETKAINQTVRRNPDRFPSGYVFHLDKDECSRSQTETLNKGGRGSNLKCAPYAFTEKGLYMLATVLKSSRATQAALAIVEAYVQLRSMVRNMEALQALKDGSPEQTAALTQTGHQLATLAPGNGGGALLCCGDMGLAA